MSEENNTFENNDQQGNGTPEGNNYFYQGQPTGNDYSSGKGQGTGLGIASMVCGILSILILCGGFVGITISVMLVLMMYLSPVLGIVAVVLGIVQIVKNESKGMAIAGIVCGAIGILIFVGIICIGLYAINTGLYDNIINTYSYY